MDAGVGPGSYAGLVAVAAVSAAVALATVRLYRCLESEFRSKIQLQHGGETSRARTTTKKKVRFADDVVEYRRRMRRSTVVAGQT